MLHFSKFVVAICVNLTRKNVKLCVCSKCLIHFWQKKQNKALIHSQKEQPKLCYFRVRVTHPGMCYMCHLITGATQKFHLAALLIDFISYKVTWLVPLPERYRSGKKKNTAWNTNFMMNSTMLLNPCDNINRIVVL